MNLSFPINPVRDSKTLFAGAKISNGVNKSEYLKMVKGCEIIFSGVVQGVGFRFSARNLAVRHKIKGWVMNLADGRVKLLAEGQREDLDDFLHDLKDEFKSYIDEYIFQEREVGGDCKDFQIKFPSS